MPHLQTRNTLFNGVGFQVQVDTMVIDSYSIEDDSLIIRAVETLDFDRGLHFYYEWEIDNDAWENATVQDNKIIIDWDPTPLVLTVWHLTTANLEEVKI